MWHKIALPVLLIVGFLLPCVSIVAQEEALKVVASHSILADVVHNIAGDRIELTTLIPVGADAHKFSTKPARFDAAVSCRCGFSSTAPV